MILINNKRKYQFADSLPYVVDAGYIHSYYNVHVYICIFINHTNYNLISSTTKIYVIISVINIQGRPGKTEA